MTVLAQCWFTREHRPDHIEKSRSSGAFESTCRYCTRRITSWNRESWHLSDGFNLEDITRNTQERYLYLIDTADEMVISRFPVSHLHGEEEIEAYRLELEAKHCSESTEGLEMRDSKDDITPGKHSHKGRRGSTATRAAR